MRKEPLSREPVQMELRNRLRYRLSADAVFSWEGPQHKQLLAEGRTRDISVAGAFIFTRTCPPVGATLDLEIFLSRPADKRGRTVQIKTQAQVIRVEHSDGAEGFAAVSHDFNLLFDKNRRNEFSVSSQEETEEPDPGEKTSITIRRSGIWNALSKGTFGVH